VVNIIQEPAFAVGGEILHGLVFFAVLLLKPEFSNGSEIPLSTMCKG
jgi:hypothetical protein